jgi:hypothetical protein
MLQSKDKTPLIILLIEGTAVVAALSIVETYLALLPLPHHSTFHCLTIKHHNANMAAPAKYTLPDLPYSQNVSILSSLRLMLRFPS